MNWNPSFAAQLGQATDMVRNGQLMEATQAIQKALAGNAAGADAAAAATAAAAFAPFASVPPATAPQPRRAKASAWRTGAGAAAADVQDAVVVERPAAARTPSAAAPAPGVTPVTPVASGTAATASAGSLKEKALQTAREAIEALSGLVGSPLGGSLKKRVARKPPKARQPRQTAQPEARVPTVPELPGSFDQVAMVHGGAGHSYRLYVPPGAASGQPMPLVLMLHGCTQDPDDFATGTHMNQAAADAGALVVYPAQQRHSNPNACWNWFSPENQQRGSGELALLVDMVRDVMARHPVDAQRVYVAGLSAGGAMAALLAREYPELFAAAGVHSGLQAGAAHSMMGALSAMKTGAKGVAETAPAARPGDLPALIVFHGDADATVSPRNGEQLVEEAVRQLGQGGVRSEVQQGQSPAGQGYTRTLFHAPAAASPSDANDVRIEQWTLHGAGHAWSGGAASGSHTDPRGVSATQEMLRFFLQHPKAAAAQPG